MLPEGSAHVRRLYYLWEQDQWEAGGIELSVDSEQWDKVAAPTRRAITDSVGWRRERAVLGMRALVLFVDLAPSEEQQVFLTTQLVDEARQLVFYDRLASEVWETDASHVGDQPVGTDDGAVTPLVCGVLQDVVQTLSESRALADLVVAVTTYSVVVEGALGLTDVRALGRFLDDRELLPGIRMGLEREATGARRHVDFAASFVADAVRRQPSLADVAEAALARSMPLVRGGIEAMAATAPNVYPAQELIAEAEAAPAESFRKEGLDLSPRG